ncbi:MAG: hypothetical protein B7Y36_08390 [Novosphingobium sp. 28-62-57]|uniref:hypothetical protein n=1 Tax=unclassified Novosphingobium TaxID=2644732 RepID=UPI000BDC2FFD|nr:MULTISPECIES: hypothetical protein [unclassified Novosphingobium]OYW47942.1 MAG: hypothetical protein B7Z36_01480 [Novosphingobium sp. 12-63-9]OYZ10835.1 MAG: hypothetical protein B7Y36_08390 [Novosphingobium sp. 28-62-57]OZA32848.1 MAG: hypothetical protein B7X92_12100 [Novosphingobium sp. 17-62-9]HQS70025.1 hypothetical protein [Novosphingobium sp.]
MKQNRSTAVMQRRIEPHDSLEYFPTPPWATRAVCELLQAEYAEPLELQRAWEPCCGELHMVRPMREYFAQVHATDVHRYAQDHGIFDFLDLGAAPPVLDVDWIFLNPPFLPAHRFIDRARTIARRGVAVFARAAFTESESRYAGLFSPDQRPACVATFCERVVLLKGRLIERNRPDPFNLDEDGKPKSASSATAYCWIIWRRDDHDTRHRWIAPGTSDRLTRPGDYPDYSHHFPEPKGSLL